MSIQDELKAFEKMRETLEAEHLGKWVLFYHQELIGTYDTFEAAAEQAVKRYGRGPYLIRQVGAPPVTLPISVMFHRPNV